MVGGLLVAFIIHVVREIGRNDNVVAVKMLDNAVFFQCHHPARVLVHAVVNDEQRLSPTQRSFYQDSWIELQNHVIVSDEATRLSRCCLANKPKNSVPLCL